MAGLLDFLGGNRSQMPGQATMSPLQTFFQPEVMLPIAGQLMGNQGNWQNAANAFTAAGPAMAQTRERNEQLAQQTKTYNWFKQNAPEFAQLIDGGAPVDQVWKLYTEQRYAKQPTNEFQERASAAEQQGLTGEDAQSFILTGQLPSGRFGSAEVGLQTVWGRDADGNYVLMQPSKSGDMVMSKTPEGVKPLSPFDKAYDTSSGQSAGKGQGEAMDLYRSMSSKMPGLRTVVDQLDVLTEQATYTWAGRTWDEVRKQFGADPRAAAVARAQYEAIVDNQILPLLRDTFGSQFTVTEGESLRATLGDPNKSPQEKKVVLKSFIEQKERDIAALASRASTPLGSPQRLRYNPATGDFE